MNADRASPCPRHIAIIMDGNGRWARKRGLPRHAGHAAGVQAARRVIEACGRQGVSVLTLFAFSSENWRRPPAEVGRLLELFVKALSSEVDDLDRNGVRVRFVGDRQSFPAELRQGMAAAESRTEANNGLVLVIAVGYGGRWDIVEAARQLMIQARTGELAPSDLDESTLRRALALADFPDPDLFIRTGGEKRISNFLLWNLAYTELYFTEILWPDFDERALDDAVADFGKRQRRFGHTPEQSGVSGRA